VSQVRIALVSTPFVAVPPPLYGGTELVVHALCRALGRLGHDVTVFATGDSRVPRLRAWFEHAVWPPDPYAELVHARFAAAEIADGAFDVVHAHVPAMLAFASGLGAPLVYTLHHVADPALERLYAETPRAIRIAISARQAALASPPPAAFVHHGLEPEMYPDVGRGGGTAFFLGRLSWVKAPDVAVEAARRAGLPIVVAGRSHPEPSPEGWRERVLGPALRAGGVTWIPGVDLAAKRRLFARSRALLVPLRWEEPFGLVMIEALLAGCPVIAEPMGAAPEIVDDGETGFLASGPRAMAKALRRAAALDRRAIQARARVRFSALRMAQEYVGVYQRALAAAARAAVRSGLAAGEAPWTTLAR
jgi:glycosyltransferase involved in cell wall biosynthesis